MKKLLTIAIGIVFAFTSVNSVYSQQLWNLAKDNKATFALSVWFTARNVRDSLSTPAGLDSAVTWCKRYGVTKVYLEAFGRGLYAERKTLADAKARLLKEGFEVQGGVTTSQFGKDGVGNGWKGAQCYTDKGTQEELQRIFEFAASLFDEIIIDDWYFTTCQCEACAAARGNQTWPEY